MLEGAAERATRGKDKTTHPKARQRIATSWAGFVVAAGGVVLVLTDKDNVYVGLAMAVIGSGALDANAAFRAVLPYLPFRRFNENVDASTNQEHVHIEGGDL